MDLEGIVPSIFTVVPLANLRITYANNKELNFGQELSPKEVQEEPKVQWDCDPEKYHTLIMFDPDAPSRKYSFLSEVNHWLVGNIKGCDLSTGDVIVEYGGSSPPKHSGFHRYFFVVLEQDNRVEFAEKKITKGSKMGRMRFSTKKFMEKYRFERVLGWNGFKAQWDGESENEARTCVCQ